MREHPLGSAAVIIGEVTAREPGEVVLETAIGGRRALTMLEGEQLPRIC
jgi:hydrogenase expression/formation protein HypE